MRIEDDTPILPDVVAECVVNEVRRHFNVRLGRRFEDALVKRQARLYEVSAPWRKKMRARGNRGRDTLYCFMRHWLAADLRTAKPDLFHRLPYDFLNGLPLTPRFLETR